MKNKTLAIFGIGIYILSVLSSATDLTGNSVSPIAFIVISGGAIVVFVIMAAIRLWEISRNISLLLISSTIALSVLSIIQFVTVPVYGSPIILSLNIIKVVYIVTFIWAVVLLWKTPKHKESSEDKKL